jgi:hypothetical protein
VDCRETRELADAFLSDQLPAETTHEVVKHLETCPACRAEFDARRLLRTRLQNAIDTAADLAPDAEFLATLAARLRPSDAPRKITRRAWLESWMPAAAALLALVGGGLVARDAWRRSHLAALAASAAGDHQNCAIKFNLAERPISLEEAAKRYDAAYAGLISLAPPRGGPTVLERHSCVFEGRRFGHVVLRYDGRIVSLLVTSGDRIANSDPAIVQNPGALHVASFDVGAHAVFVVSDLPESETLTIAQALADPVRRALERG